MVDYFCSEPHKGDKKQHAKQKEPTIIGNHAIEEAMQGYEGQNRKAQGHE